MRYQGDPSNDLLDQGLILQNEANQLNHN